MYLEVTSLPVWLHATQPIQESSYEVRFQLPWGIKTAAKGSASKKTLKNWCWCRWRW